VAAAAAVADAGVVVAQLKFQRQCWRSGASAGGQR
jgi:hypothetical protein